jgi:hypothetical protein
MDQDYLYSLNFGGIKVLDPKKNIYLEVRNTMQVKMIHCYNTHTKQFLALKDSEDGLTFILSHVKW